MLQVLQHFLSMLHQAAKITSPTGRHGLTTQSHASLQQRQHILSTSTTRPLFPQPVPPTAPNLAWNVNDGRLCITTDNSHPSALQYTVHCFGTSTEQLWQRTLYTPNVTCTLLKTETVHLTSASTIQSAVLVNFHLNCAITGVSIHLPALNKNAPSHQRPVPQPGSQYHTGCSTTTSCHNLCSSQLRITPRANPHTSASVHCALRCTSAERAITAISIHLPALSKNARSRWHLAPQPASHRPHSTQGAAQHPLLPLNTAAWLHLLFVCGRAAAAAAAVLVGPRPSSLHSSE